MSDETYQVKNAVMEIVYDVSYLEDAPDEKLVPFVETLGIIGERLLKLKECLSNQT